MPIITSSPTLPPTSPSLKRSSGSHEGSSTKRSRTEESIKIKSTNHWYDDGNVIMEAENTQFRVHKSVLSRHFNVFEDMFSVAQPASANRGKTDINEILDLELYDRASDFEYALSCIYPNIKSDTPDDETKLSPLEQCGALIRMGDKYEAQHLVDEGLKKFTDTFPSDISNWDVYCDCERLLDETIPKDKEFWFYATALALAHEFTIKEAVPAICLSLLLNYKTSIKISEHMLEIHSSTHPYKSVITRQLQKCLSGREEIIRRLHHKITDWITMPLGYTHTNCARNRPDAIRQVLQQGYVLGEDNFLSPEIMDRIGTSTIETKDDLCNLCITNLKRYIKAFREDMWNVLPSLFLEPGDTWDTLKIHSSP